MAVSSVIPSPYSGLYSINVILSGIFASIEKSLESSFPVFFTFTSYVTISPAFTSSFSFISSPPTFALISVLSSALFPVVNSKFVASTVFSFPVNEFV